MCTTWEEIREIAAAGCWPGQWRKESSPIFHCILNYISLAQFCSVASSIFKFWLKNCFKNVYLKIAYVEINFNLSCAVLFLFYESIFIIFHGAAVGQGERNSPPATTHFHFFIYFKDSLQTKTERKQNILAPRLSLPFSFVYKQQRRVGENYEFDVTVLFCLIWSVLPRISRGI